MGGMGDEWDKEGNGREKGKEERGGQEGWMQGRSKKNGLFLSFMR